MEPTIAIFSQTRKVSLDDLVLGSKAFYASTRKTSIIAKPKTIPAHIARVGTFNGYMDDEGNPTSFTLTRQMFDDAIRNFELQANPAPVYRGHADVMFAVEEPRASGWIVALERRGDDLWALVDLTESLAEEIEAGEYRYTSIYLEPNAIDRVSGKKIGSRLRSLAITNQPFIDGLTPLTLSSFAKDRALSKNTKGIFMSKQSTVETKKKNVSKGDEELEIDIVLADGSTESKDEEEEKKKKEAPPGPVDEEEEPEPEDPEIETSETSTDEEEKDEEEMMASEDSSSDEEEKDEEKALLKALQDATGASTVLDALKSVLDNIKAAEASDEEEASTEEEATEEVEKQDVLVIIEEDEEELMFEENGEDEEEEEKKLSVLLSNAAKKNPASLVLAVKRLRSLYLSSKKELEQWESRHFDSIISELENNHVTLSAEEKTEFRKAFKTDKKQFDFMLSILQKGMQKQVKREQVLLSQISKPNMKGDENKKKYEKVVLTDHQKRVLRGAGIEVD